MFNWLGEFKWFIKLAQRDKVLALITVMAAVIFLACFVTWKVSSRSNDKDDKNEVKADIREHKCDSLVSVKDAQIAALNVKIFEVSNEYNADLKSQRDEFQKIAIENANLTKQLSITNKRNARKLKELTPEIDQRNEN